MFRFLVVLFTILLCSQFVNAAELPGYKTLVSPQGTYRIQVPEKAPDFLTAGWEEDILTYGRFPNGTAWAIRIDQKDGMAVQSLVIVKPENPKQPLMVIFCVSYDGGEPTDFYLDAKFLETGEPSGIFSGPTCLAPAKEKLEQFVQRFNLKI